MAAELFGCIGLIVIGVANTLVSGWVIMLLLGLLYNEGVGVPALGYWASCGLGILVTMVMGLLRGR